MEVYIPNRGEDRALHFSHLTWGSGGYSYFLKRKRMTDITERQIWQLAQRHCVTPVHTRGLCDTGGEYLPNRNVRTIQSIAYKVFIFFLCANCI